MAPCSMIHSFVFFGFFSCAEFFWVRSERFVVRYTRPFLFSCFRGKDYYGAVRGWQKYRPRLVFAFYFLDNVCISCFFVCFSFCLQVFFCVFR